jgi:hypothetical protein
VTEPEPHGEDEDVQRPSIPVGACVH